MVLELFGSLSVFSNKVVYDHILSMLNYQKPAHVLVGGSSLSQCIQLAKYPNGHLNNDQYGHECKKSVIFSLFLLLKC